MTKPFSHTIRNNPAVNVNAFFPSFEFVNRICGNTVSPSAPLITTSGLRNTIKCFWKPTLFFARALTSLASTTPQPSSAISSITLCVGMCVNLADTVGAAVSEKIERARFLTSLIDKKPSLLRSNITFLFLIFKLNFFL